jgi:RNA 2',3'-cyclic 3'-phosphodiesterase
VRVFVALDIPDTVRNSLAELGARLKNTCRAARWVRVEGVHVTLKFIGEVPPEQVDRIRMALADIRGTGPADVRFAGLGFFPDARRPRVLWVGVESDAALRDLVASIGAKLASLGIPHETRDFHPHITLARFNSQEGLESLSTAVAEFRQTEFGHATTGKFHLYRSVLKPSGAEYTRLETYSFAGEHAP